MAVPSLLGGSLVHFLPESPKFLMSRGRNEAALEVFQEIYRRNNGGHVNAAVNATATAAAASGYPVTQLADEKYQSNRRNRNAEELNDQAASTPATVAAESRMAIFKAGVNQMMLMFSQPYLRNCLLVFAVQFGFLYRCVHPPRYKTLTIANVF